MPKISNEKKLQFLKDWLTENDIPFVEDYHSRTFGVTMNLKIKGLRIAVFVSKGNKEEEDVLYNAKSTFFKKPNAPLYVVYKPFFIRESDSKKFVIEKMQNCLRDRMLLMQKKWLKKQEKMN